ncbi:hypothetical protein Barba19A_gp055 [Rheinheimera phage vB_RspM_Barba19A]|jgi:hypothetical protein|uniref:Uncharacterized protein n=2 Tax=Barbavirus barba19A TaxID=2734091 RepID=A0A4V1EZZ3_9CAUD|nr:hypothetical protein HOV47_gp055 [Rheinheimera phage vB_RspM_Barba19A]QCQ61895.1 hypothetical protein Barba19A_gp055 [Rheinheimera phage vB_RspM_Barba19A]QCQ64645.1 hypothetical protein Barba31A_gp055 [Rheinheimera phage vB_RspM_Barba31A]
MVDFSDYLGKQKIELKSDFRIRLLCKQHSGFSNWFGNKFLKWEYDMVDRDEVENLNSSFCRAYLELN